MDRLEAIRVFVAVADSKGFASVARRLNLSPSAVTRMVAGLEDQLGIRLLQRTTRSVTLTDAGTRYLERTRRILGDLAEADDAARAERTVPTGRFILAAPNVFGRLHVAPLMCTYLAKYPDVQGELMLSDRMANLVEDGIDAAVRIGVLEDSSHVARAVGATRRVVVASPNYLAKHKKIRSPQDIGGAGGRAEHATIQFTALTPSREWQFMHKGEGVRIPIDPRYVTNAADAALGHAEGDGGLTMVLGYQAADAIKSGKLRVVLSTFEFPALPIHIVYPSTRLLSAKVRAFIELVTTTCNWRFVDF